MRTLIVISALGLLSACDMRGNFVGGFRGSGTNAIRWSTGSTNQQNLERVLAVFTAPSDSSSLVMASRCELRLTPISWYAMRFDPTNCPPRQAVFQDNSTCRVEESVSGGEGTLQDGKLRLQRLGEIRLSSCSDGFTGRYTYELTFNLERFTQEPSAIAKPSSELELEPELQGRPH